jgi:hypothetical protein
MHSMVRRINVALEEESLHALVRNIMEWLSAPDAFTNFNNARAKCHPRTGSWIFEHPVFLRWKAEENNFIWCHRIPGYGKTILSSTIIDYLHSTQIDTSFPILMFFFDFNDPNKQSYESLIRSLIKQLYLVSKTSRDLLASLYYKYNEGNSAPSTESLSKTLQSIFSFGQKIYIIIDALDECRDREKLIRWMRDMCSSTCGNLHIIVTSRTEADIQSGINTWANEKDFISLQQTLVDPDIREFIRTILHDEVGGFQRWRSRPEILTEIELELTAKAAGM